MSRLILQGIAASPRKDANSLFLLEQAFEGARREASGRLTIERFSFHGKRIFPCIQCYRCDETAGDCVIRDDFQELRDAWLKADIVIYSVPVWHLSIPSQLKAFFDRLGQSLSKRYVCEHRGERALHLKVIGNIAQGMDIFAGQEHALLDLMHHTVLQNCLPVSGDTYIGVGGWARWSRDPDRIERLAEQGDVVGQFSITAAQSLGKRCVQIASVLRAGFERNGKLLESDPAFRPVRERLTLAKEIDGNES